MAYSDQVVSAESGGDPNSQSSTSSASGPAGFINSTWLDTVKANRPDLAQGKSDAEILALKADPVLSGQMAEAYGNANGDILAKNGLPVTEGTKYLAHFAGPQGAVKILQADPSAMASDILGSKVLAANPFLQGMTAQGLQAWAAKKMGVQAPQPGMQNSAPQTLASAPMALPQGQAPIFPAAPPQQQAAPQQEAAQAPMQFEQPNAPPIFFAPRPRVNLTNLRNAFHAPVFPRG